MSSGFIGFRRSLLGFLGFFAALAILGMFKVTSGFIQPFVIALLLSFILNPLVELFVRIKIPRFLAIVLVIFVLLGISVLIGAIVFQSIQSIIAEYAKYQSRFLSLVNFLTTEFDLPPNLISTLEITRTTATLLVNISSGFFGFLGNVSLTLVFLLFILLERPYMKRKLREAFHDKQTENIGAIFVNINNQVGRYLIIKFFVSFLTAAIIFIGFTFLGLDFPIIWAILTFLFNFIPTIGSIVITGLTGIFAVIQFFPEWNIIIGILTLMTVTQLLIGNILDPKLTGDSLNLSPVVILLALLLWGWLWGTTGLFLAIPLTVSMKIIFEYVPGLEFLGIVMGTGAIPSVKKTKAVSSDPIDSMIDS